MIMELVGNRLLAPLFGNTIFAWTALIGIILISVSVGNYWGGILSEKAKHRTYLFFILLVCGAFVANIVLIQNVLTQYFYRLNIIYGPVVVSMVLFCIPGILIGTVTPFCARLYSKLKNDTEVGRSIGLISTLATTGSVFGTFLAGFILIPNFDIRYILLACGALLSVFAFFLNWHFLRTRHATLFLLLATSTVVSTFFYKSHNANTLIFQKESMYNKISVYEKNDTKYLVIGAGLHGGQHNKDYTSPFPFQNFWLKLISSSKKDIKRVLVIGGGSFTMPVALSATYPSADIDVVEIDKEVIDVGHKFFKLDRHKNINTYADDARHFLATTKNKYDVILFDAYGSDIVPFHLVTRDFLTLVAMHLERGGVYFANVVGAIGGDKTRVFPSYIKTLKSVFPYAYVFSTDSGKFLLNVDNIVTMATREPTNIMDTPYYIPDSAYKINSGKLVTDNYNPMEYLAAKELAQPSFLCPNMDISCSWSRLLF